MSSNRVIYSDEVALGALAGGKGGYLHVRLDGQDWRDGRNVHVVNWKLLDYDMDELASNDDISSPVGFEKSALRALRALTSFLGAFVEASDESSENWDLFPQSVREWAELESDEISMLQLEIDAELEREF